MKLSDFLKLTADDFDAMSADDLTELQHQASDWRDQLKAQQRALVGVLDGKLQHTEALRRFEKMSDAEKAALIQHVRDVGEIASDEAFGKP